MSEPTIPFPSSAMFGVAIRADGSMENIGIGTFETDQAEALANQLTALAEAIRAAAMRRFSSQ